MLRTFALHDAALGGKRVGTFRYSTADMQFSLTIFADIPLIDLPLSLDGFAKHGKYELGHDDTLDWVRERICPPGRQNIDSILHDLGLAEYDEMALLSYTNGRCDKDELYLVEEGRDNG
ncbi:MAG: hypothetical protein LBB91_06860 [Clostridiales bacterium]|nr:hypothetical protein [Clostridiales bacterium]